MSRRILIVDDEPDVRDYLSSYLEDQGYETLVAEDCSVAMVSIESSKPDLILLDLMMPEESGAGLCRKLCETEEYRDIPIFVISGIVEKDIAVIQSLPTFEKPIDKEALLASIKNVFGVTK
jgi:DNA-binding response OmpR family regulator